MAATNPAAKDAAASPAPPSSATKAQDRRLRLEDVLKLMVVDGLVQAADADALARSRASRGDHPLEFIANQKWRAAAAPHALLTLDFLVEWLAGKLGVPYLHVDPLKIDLTAVTQTMSNAYAERYRILPVDVTRSTLTVATSEPFVRSWADELEKILKLEVKFVFANPADIRRFLGEFYTLARSMKKAQETSQGAGLARAELRAAGRARPARERSTPTTATSSTSSTGFGSTRSSSAHPISMSSRAATSASSASGSTACCTRCTRSRSRC